MLLRLAMPFSLHLAFARLVIGLRGESRPARLARRAVRAWRTQLIRAWACLRLCADGRARRLVAWAYARGHRSGRLMLLGFEHWAARSRGRRMRQALATALDPTAAAISYAFGRLALCRRVALAERERRVAARRHRVRRALRVSLHLWAGDRSTSVALGRLRMTSVAFELATGARRAYLALALHAHRQLSFLRASAALRRYRRRAGLRSWWAAALAVKVISNMGGTAGRRGRTAERRRAFVALRANARACAVGRALAGASFTGRRQLKELAMARACERLRTNATAQRTKRHSVLVATQRGHDRRCAALLQPLQALWALRLTRSLQVWRAAVTLVVLSRRMDNLHSLLATERELKRVHFEAEQRAFREDHAPNGEGGANKMRTVEVARSALDKLFRLLEDVETIRLRPVLHAWRAAAAALPSPLGYHSSAYDARGYTPRGEGVGRAGSFTPGTAERGLLGGFVSGARVARVLSTSLEDRATPRATPRSAERR